MISLLSKFTLLLSFYLVCANLNSNRILEEEEVVDDCVEFYVNIIPVRLENLKAPIDFEKELIRLGYYEPRHKYEFEVCKEDDLNDCQLRYSDSENYTVLKSDRDYKKVTQRYELHGKSIYRTHSYVFKYETVKLKLDEGLIKGENGEADSCKEGYRSCGKFNRGEFEPYTILCFPEEYDCPFKDIKGASDELSGYTEHIKLEDNIILNFVRFTENDYILSLFTGFMYIPMSQRENLNNLPFTFTHNTSAKYQSIFGSSGMIDLRELLKENNIHSHFLDFYLKGIKIDTNTTFQVSLSARFESIKNIERKCGVKEEPREEYEFDDYDGDCISMIEHITPIKANGTEKIYEKDVLQLANYVPFNQYEHFLCKTSNKSDCKLEYNNDSIYEKMYYDKDYDLMNTTFIGDTAKPVYLYYGKAFKVDKINIHFKESFDTELYKCKDEYRACARIKHHPWATLLCVPKMSYCPFSDTIGDMYIKGDPYYEEMYPYNFGYKNPDRDVISFHFGRYKMNDTVNYITKGLFLRNGFRDKFYEIFPFYISEYYKGVKPVAAYQDRVTNMERVFTENGIPTKFVKLYYPDENYQTELADDRKTRMYLMAHVDYFKNEELVCEEPSSNNEVILYAVWTDKDKSESKDDETPQKTDAESQGDNEGPNVTPEVTQKPGENEGPDVTPQVTDKPGENEGPDVTPQVTEKPTQYDGPDITPEVTEKPIENEEPEVPPGNIGEEEEGENEDEDKITEDKNEDMKNYMIFGLLFLSIILLIALIFIK